MVWALIASMYIGNVMLLILNLPLVGLWVKLLNIPKSYLYAGILVFSTLACLWHAPKRVRSGAAVRDWPAGRGHARFDFPAAPVVVGMILGPLAEAQMRNAVAIGEGKWTIFLERPGSLTLIVIVLCVLIIPRLLKRRAARLATG
jgi:putative tricarboxylic transport membrane protein